MTPERARELAIAILFGMVGNNDEIVNDPSRWGDPLQSFSFDEVAIKIEEAILQACAEERAGVLKNEFICAKCQLRHDSTRETKHEF